VTARDVITTIRQRIYDAEKAGVREVPLSNLRGLIDQIEQGISADRAKTLRGTGSGNSQSKSGSGSMNKKQKALTIVALIAFIVMGACYYTKLCHYEDTRNTPTKYGTYLSWAGSCSQSEPLLSDVKTPWFMLGVTYAALFFLLQNKRDS
jgi:hypothetical protein